MDILNDKFNKNPVSKPELEQIEKEKVEYKLIGKYLRTPGLRLYSYNSLKDELKELEITVKDTVSLVPDENNQLVPTEQSSEEVQVDTRNIHFEALNQRTAKNRVSKYKKDKIKELCNLREHNPDGINFY